MIFKKKKKIFFYFFNLILFLKNIIAAYNMENVNVNNAFLNGGKIFIIFIIIYNITIK